MKHIAIIALMLFIAPKLDAQPEIKLLKELGKHEEIANCVVISHSGELLASGSNDNKIKVFAIPSGKLITSFTAHSVGIADLVFSNDDKLLISAGRDELIRLWDVGSWQRKAQLNGHKAPVNALAVNPINNHLFSGADDKTIIEWNLESGSEIHRYTGHIDRIIDLDISGNGEYLASSAGDKMSKSDKNLAIWNLRTKQNVFWMEEDYYAIQSVSLNSSGSMVLFGGNFQEVILMKWESSKILAKKALTDYGLNTVQLHGLDVLAGSTFNGQLSFWHIGGDFLYKQAHEGDIFNLFYHPKTGYITTVGRDGKVILWELSP